MIYFNSFSKLKWVVRRKNWASILFQLAIYFKEAVEVFSSVGSLVRLIGSILIDQNEEWITGRRYLNMEMEKETEEVEEMSA